MGAWRREAQELGFGAVTITGCGLKEHKASIPLETPEESGGFGGEPLQYLLCGDVQSKSGIAFSTLELLCSTPGAAIPLQSW